MSEKQQHTATYNLEKMLRKYGDDILNHHPKHSFKKKHKHNTHHLEFRRHQPTHLSKSAINDDSVENTVTHRWNKKSRRRMFRGNYH